MFKVILEGRGGIKEREKKDIVESLFFYLFIFRFFLKNL